jgi:FkbM family methyltransferase
MTENPELVTLKNTLSCYAPNPKEAQFIYKEIFEDHCYDIPNLVPSSASEFSEPFIIDAGANIGLFTLYMKQKYPASKILAFEPAPQLFELLSRNLALNNISFANGIYPHDGSVDVNTGVEVFPVGLSSTKSEEKLTYYPTLPSNSTLKPAEKVLLHRKAVERSGQEMADHWFGGSFEVDVHLQRLSYFLTNNNSKNGARVIDLLKIDVEGAELDVLKGLDDDHWLLIRNIVLETMEKSGIRAEIEGLLRAKGFEITIEGAPWAPEEFYTIKAHREVSST